MMVRLLLFLLSIYPILEGSTAFSQEVEEIKVSSQRLPDSLSEQVYSAVALDQTALDGPAFGLDDALRRVPGFGLFRRQASRASHPTTQGVSLRGLGPNGAGRTLVLLDGVPQNDPFGGWIEWVHLPPSSIGQAKVIRGGGAGPWGNAALAGVVRLDSRTLNDKVIQADLRYGSRSSVAGTVVFETGGEAGTLFGNVHASDSDSYFAFSPDQRGAADRRLARHSEGARLGWRTQTSNGTVWSISGSAGSDSFVNGSDVAGAKTDTFDASITALNDAPRSGPSWQSSLYARRKEFESVFGAFDATRASVRPVLDQFDVPATMVGGNVILRWENETDWTVESGADFRLADGETNERFRNLGAGFTRSRTAGGEQMVAGAFVEGHWQGAGTLFTVGGRIDRWQQRNGQRIETNLADGVRLVDRSFDDRSGWVANGRLGVKADIAQNMIVRASAYTGFRVPTLNELYRPFRVGNDITEANNALKNERLAGAEIGFEWRQEQYSITANVFRNDLLDPVANTTITNTPGFNSEFGVFIPGGGSLRQRRNLDRVETWGTEIDALIAMSPAVDVRMSYLFTDPTIKKSLVSPGLIGNRLAQVPRQRATVGLDMRPIPNLTATVDVLASSKQFEDDLNSRVLDSAVTVNAQFAYRISDAVEIYLAAENLFDARIEAGRSATGLVTLGAPVFLWGGIRLAY